MLTIPASSSVLSGSLLIKHLSLIQAPVPPCALAGIYLSTSEPSVDLSSQRSAGLGIAMISAPQIKSETQAELRAACRRLSTLQPPAHYPSCCIPQLLPQNSPQLTPGTRWFPPAPYGQPQPAEGFSPWLFLIHEMLREEHWEPRGPSCSPPALSLLTDDSWDEGSSGSALLTLQPARFHEQRQNKQICLAASQDKQGTKLGANCNTTDWQSALFPAPYKYWSQLSALFAVFLGRSQHPQSIDVWLHGPVRAWLSWGPLRCSSSPSSQAGLRNLLLLLLLQALKPTGKPEFNLTAAEYGWIKTHWPSKILFLKCNLCLALNA